MQRSFTEGTFQGLSESSVSVFAPTRSVITDMIMVQLLSIIMALVLLMLFKGNELSTNDVSLFLVAIFGSSILLGGIYSRITS
jgi:hypothetical protein|tara:strand:- start:139 stop:387 length:249 start_codon:yes stop_codon:yes gene_type:complete